MSRVLGALLVAMWVTMAFSDPGQKGHDGWDVALCFLGVFGASLMVGSRD